MATLTSSRRRICKFSWSGHCRQVSWNAGNADSRKISYAKGKLSGEEPCMDQYQSKEKLLTNFQRHWSIRISLKTRQRGHWSIRISLESHMDQRLPNASEKPFLAAARDIGPQCSHTTPHKAYIASANLGWCIFCFLRF